MKNVLLFTALFLITTVCNATVYYVDAAQADNTGAGTSWATAKKDIQNAIDISSSGDEIWVKAGIYYPTWNPGGSNTNKTILMKFNTILYGGFVGNETSLFQRNPKLNETIISGNIGSPSSQSDNCKHVITSVLQTTPSAINGFTISDGYTTPNLANSTAYLLNGIPIYDARGAAIYSYNSGTILKNIVFENNTCTEGAAIYADSSSLNITDVFFDDNNAFFGGGINLENTQCSLSNCVFSGNEAIGQGGAVWLKDCYSSNISQCTFYDNAAHIGVGNAILTNNPSGGLSINNSIFYNNLDTGSSVDLWPIHNFNASASVEYSLVRSQSNPTFVYSGTGNITGNPQFFDQGDIDGLDNIYGTEDDGLYILGISPCVNAGDASISTPINDITGLTRHSTFDMGAYENRCGGTYPDNRLYVNHLATGNATGVDWSNALTDLQDAINFTKTCPNIDEIWVAEGTYKPSKDYLGNSVPVDPRSKTFYLADGVKIYGGFTGTESSITQRNWSAHPTILSGDIGIPSDSSDNTYHVVVSYNNNAGELDGFTIQDGNANGSGYLIPSNLASPSQGSGGGINVRLSNLALSNTAVVNNTASKGGAISYGQSQLSKVENCLLIDNNSTNIGGAINSSLSTPLITHTTIANNMATNNGGGLYIVGGAFSPLGPTINNSILYNNTSGGTAAIHLGTNGLATVNYSIVQGTSVYAGTGNSNANPLFINQNDANGPDNTYMTVDDGINIPSNSPAINGGDPSIVQPALDIVGTTRTGVFDMGAYEYDPCHPQASNVLYVDSAATGNNSGVNWANAYSNMQEALEAAALCPSVNQIWVAKGTYYPSKDPFGNASPADPRDKTFHLLDSIAIYGGFVGTESSTSQRNWKMNPTILSGDIGVTNDSTDNAYHVVLSVVDSGTTAVDGFIIRDGNANGIGTLSVEGDMTFREGGGGMAMVSSQVKVANCVLKNNNATYGGGIQNVNSNTTISKSVFFQNNSSQTGGAMSNENSSAPIITDCVFSENTALNGSAIMNLFASSDISNCTFSMNASASASCIANVFSNLQIENSIVYGNTGSSQGISNSSSTTTANYSIVQGSVLAGTGNSNVNPLFLDSTDADGADDIFMTADDGYSLLASSPAVDASDPNLTAIVSDIKGHIRFGVYDQGAYEYNTCGNISGGIVYVDSSASGLNTGSSWANAFTSLQTALEVIRYCPSATEVWVAAGTYYPTKRAIGNNIPSNNRAKAFQIYNNFKVYGGFNGTETQRAQRDWDANSTILSGDLGVLNVNNDNCYHVVYMAGVGANTILDGFVIEKGYANSALTYQGAGILAYSTSALIKNCTIRNNSSVNTGTSYKYGGAVYVNCQSSPSQHFPKFDNCKFLNNSNAGGFGGALAFFAVNMEIKNCSFEGNISTSRGGAIWSYGYYASFINSVFKNNSSNKEGGAIYMNYGETTVSGCVFDSNTAVQEGGAIHFYFTGLGEITDCTFTNNHSDTAGGAIGHLGFAVSHPLAITNSTFKNNTSVNGGAIFNFPYSSLKLKRSKFLENQASVGGAIFSHSRDDLSITGSPVWPSKQEYANCFFHKNIATNGIPAGGGAIFDHGDTLIYNDCVFSENNAGQVGGVLTTYGNSRSRINNCTFIRNYTGGGNFGNIHYGSISALGGGSQTAISNSIFYDNPSPLFGPSPPSTKYCLGLSGGTGNFIADPLFVDTANLAGADSIWGTADDGLRLTACSPAIDAGLTSFVASNDTLDAQNTLRIQGDRVDRGAYESVALPSQIRSVANSTDTANQEFTDAYGWTNYCNCDTPTNPIWLLSLKKNGNNIGHVDSGLVLTISTTNLYGTNAATDLSSAPYVTADTFFAMNRYWQVAPTSQPTNPVEIRFPYSSADFTDLQSSQTQLMNHTDMAFFKIDGSHNPHSLTVPSSAYHNYAHGSVVDTNTWKYTDYTAEIPNVHYAEYAVNSFSGGGGGFGNGSNNGPLPVTYLDFSVYKLSTSNLVKWTTTSEINNNHFNVQRSANAIDFETLGSANSKAIDGSTTQQLNYSFIDEQPQIGNNYYRLEQVDIDGKKSYSKVINIVWTEEGTLSIYPNPTSDILNIDFSLMEANSTEIKLIDMSGRVVKSVLFQSEKGMNHTEISMSELASGMYHLQLLQNNKPVFVGKISRE